MEILVFIILTALTAYCCMRYILLKKAVKESSRELHEISEDLEQNRIVRLPSPHHDMEELLQEINTNLEAIRKTRIRYEEKERTLQKQIENVSHDLRTPLTSILGFLDLIDENSLSDDDRESLDVVKRKARSLKKMIAQFYDLSRLTAGDYPLQPEKVDIGRKLRESTLDSYQELKKKNLEVQLDIPKKPVFALADEDALERIFGNLLQNAGRYAESMLKVRLLDGKESVTVVMENDTVHLDQSEIEALFERFYTADRSRSEGSTGLGLPIAKHLAEEMGGNLSAEIRVQGGRKWLQFYLEVKKADVCDIMSEVNLQEGMLTEEKAEIERERLL